MLSISSSRLFDDDGGFGTGVTGLGLIGIFVTGLGFICLGFGLSFDVSGFNGIDGFIGSIAGGSDFVSV